MSAKIALALQSPSSIAENVPLSESAVAAGSLRETRPPRCFAGARGRNSVVAGLLAALAFGAAGAASEPAGLLLEAPDGSGLPVIEHSLHATIHVAGPVAEVEIRQRFENASSIFAEGRYLLPLPEKSAVHRLTIKLPDRTIEGEVRERLDAAVEYAAALAEGRSAALVEMNRPNRFATRVANIPPHSTVDVVVGYWQRLDHDGRGFRLNLPLAALAPYGDSGQQGFGTKDAAGVATLNLPATPGAVEHRLTSERGLRSIEITLVDESRLDQLSSATHDISIAPGPAGTMVRWQGTGPDAARDFELAWKLAVSGDIDQRLHVEDRPDGRYVLAMLTPPVLPRAVLPRELVLLVDTSGSMEGRAIDEARRAAVAALRELSPFDRFEVIRFAGDLQAFEPSGGAVLASAEAIAQATSFVEGFQADGGTELGAALTTALSGTATLGFVRQVVLITDAGVGNERELLNLITASLGASRLFVVGLGNAPNSWFIREAARVGRGSALVVRELADLEHELSDFFQRINRPALRDLRLRFPAGTEVYPTALPDLYAGEPLTIAARLPRQAAGGAGRARSELQAIQATGEMAGRRWSAQLVLGATAAAESTAVVSQAGIARLFAIEKIAALDDAERLGADAALTRQAIIDTALEHQLVSRYTSLVAVSRQRVRAEGEPVGSVAVDSSASDDNLALAQGGLNLDRGLGGGLLLSLVGLALWRARSYA